MRRVWSQGIDVDHGFTVPRGLGVNTGVVVHSGAGSAAQELAHQA